MPRRPDVGVIALVNEPWSERWQPRHQVLSRLARDYHVIWMTPAHEWRESLERLGAGPALSSPASVNGALTVYRPESWLPSVYRPRAVGDALYRARLLRARAHLRRRGCTHIVLSLWGLDHARALDAVAHDVSCFHIDDEYTFDDTNTGDDAGERALLARVDGVFIHSANVYARKATYCRHATLSPNGVDFDAFAKPVPIPDDLAGIPRPILGYTGYVKRQLDWPLMLELARSRPEWSFVFVGARSPHPDIAATLDAMDALPNVHMLGGKTTGELTRYPQHFDVCLLPYRMTDYTDAIDPLKLGEYMAAGRPAVGSAIAPLRAVGGLVSVARTQQEWDESIARALGPDACAPDRIEQRRDWARARSWETSTAMVSDFVTSVLARRATETTPAVALATD